jgi:AraC-like DNA-binding protein
MDILTDVVDALELEATGVLSLRLAAEHTENVGPGQAVVVIVVRGACELAGGGDRAELIENDYVLLFGGQAAAFRNRSAAAPCRLIVCSYTVQTASPHPLARQLPAVVRLASRHLTDPAELGRAVAMLDGELVNASLGTDFVCRRLAEVAFVDVLRRCQLEERAEPAFLAALSDGPVRAALELIHRLPSRTWHLDDLATEAGLSRGAFSERFHRRVGEPPLRYLRCWRLLRARRELIRAGMRVHEVAAQAGYRSASGFSRAFRRFFGETPSAARASSRPS